MPFLTRSTTMPLHLTRPLVHWLWRGSRIVILGASVLLLAPGRATGTAPDTASRQCTARNVAGTYGFVGHGTILPNPAHLPEGLFATVGLLTFDGQARWSTSTQSLTLNGTVTTGASMAGTYTVQPDCTFTLASDLGPVDAGVLVQDRQEGFFMATVQGVVVTFTMKRINTSD